MKKFIAPEVNTVELGQADVIMNSLGVTDKNTFTKVVADDTSAQYEMWKGFNAE